MEDTQNIPKFGLVSHTLPPSPSGQAVVLYNLLLALPADSYCLISQTDYERELSANDASEKLPATYHRLKSRRWKALLTPFERPIWLRKIVSGLLRFYNGVAKALWPPDALLRLPFEIFSRSRQIQRIAEQEKCAVLIACTADFHNLPATYWACRRLKLPFIPYIFDDYAEQWSGLKKWLARRLEPFLIKNAWRVIVPNEYMAAEYVRRYGVESTIIRNLTPLPDLTTLDTAAPFFDTQTINIVYTGSLYNAQYQAFFNLKKALEYLERSEIRLHIFTSHNPQKLRAEGLDSPYIVFHPHYPQQEILAITRQADILFLPLALVSDLAALIKTSLPGKTASYLAVGRPILVHAPDDAFITWYFEQNQCGMVVSENDPQQLAVALEALIADADLQKELGTRALECAKRDFDAEKVRQDFITLLSKLASMETP